VSEFADSLIRLLTLQDYNTRVVVIGTSVLGAAAGVVGSFTLLRRRALLGDAVAHATLPGIALAFIVASLLGRDGKSLPLLLTGATISGVLGVMVIVWLRRVTRLKEDTAMGIVLSVFFGGGAALLRITEDMPGGRAAGLESFILGKTASMISSDVQLIIAAAIICLILSVLFIKELTLLCFDDGFAGSRGFPVLALDFLLMSMVIVVCIVGLQAVGLVLMIALLVTPAAAARFWTDRLPRMMIIAALIGAAGGYIGSSLSAIFPDLPSGAMIVLTCSTFFGFSLLFGRRRGVVLRWWRRHVLNRSVARQHLLRALFELQEGRMEDQVGFDELLNRRSWNTSQLKLTIRRAIQEEMVTQVRSEVTLTKKGFVEAERLTRDHRLWELYLLRYAQVAPARIDRQADRIEHVLEAELIAELKAILDSTDSPLPPSPHNVEDAPGTDHKLIVGGPR
jgi:manganese/zinc/iron transport system permease protein